jgi:hypothetical protein
MKNKEVCRACVNANRTRYSDLRSKQAPMPWDDEDDRHWENGMIVCPYPKLSWLPRRPIDEIKECRYQLEHLMAWQK